MAKVTKANTIWIQLLFIICFFSFLICFSSVQPSFAQEIEVPEAAIDITESDFPLTIENEYFYRFVPEKDVLINDGASVFGIFQEQDGKCLSIETEKAIGDWVWWRNGRIYCLKKNNTYYLQIVGNDTLDNFSGKGTIRLIDSIKITLYGTGGNIFGSEKYEFYVPVNVDAYSSQKDREVSREGFVFKGWNTKPDGTGFYPSQYQKYTQDVTFYALWNKLYNVTLDANGGYFHNNTVDPDTNDYMKKSIVEVQAIEFTPGYGGHLGYYSTNDDVYEYHLGSPLRDGYQFKEYNTSPDGKGISYGDAFTIIEGGDSYDTTYKEDTKLYAIWICPNGNHQYSDWRTVKEPTYAEDGSNERICSKCGNTEASTIPKLTVKKTSLSKLPAVKKGFTAKWKKGKSINGYQIQYGLKSNFKGAKTVTVTKAGITSKKITKLKSKKKYFVRIRTYKTVNGVKYYSDWSKSKSVKTK